ncbi:tubulin-specific chaperone cofactor E-like protein [Pecten maximus]|uniref:tubulin-specific chaperone cofactor E-like protein n=1 Tax=Pecten maximus TaxID=6579 RepID=UPI0014582C07|nr:tubulin-specific chaperone cofactor E-like protein [Pecten maximus]
MEAEKKRQGRRRLPRQKSFTEALKEKYCTPEIDSCNSGGFVVNIVYHGKPKTNGSDAELAYLRNVVLCDRHVSMAGIPSDGLRSLCPNVNDLDLSGNLLDDWGEVLTIMSNLPFLKFVNFSRNKIINKKNFLQKWETPLNTVESLVLNETNVTWDEVLTVAKYLPSLKELHTCKNGYTQLSSSSLGVLEKVTYLKMNHNEIHSWEEVWKLRHLPELDTLILSGNPLKDVAYKLLDDADHVSMETNDAETEGMDKDEGKEENGNKSSNQYAKDHCRPGSRRGTFRKSLCLSDTRIDSWDHLQALSIFPALESLRIQDIHLLSEQGEDDRRKLKIASLPNIKILNGSEVTVTEREKAERYFIRYFMDQESQPERYSVLEAKHGKLEPIVDVDISRGFKEVATLTFILNGKTLCKGTFKVKDLVHELKVFVAKKLDTRLTFKMFHYGCGPNHPEDEEMLYQELQSELLQMSRFDIMDGDEIHIFMDRGFQIQAGHLNYLYIRAFTDFRK